MIEEPVHGLQQRIVDDEVAECLCWKPKVLGVVSSQEQQERREADESPCLVVLGFDGILEIWQAADSKQILWAITTINSHEPGLSVDGRDHPYTLAG
jgi:hypothetical protein